MPIPPPLPQRDIETPVEVGDISLVEAEQVAWEMGRTLCRLSLFYRWRFNWAALVRLADKFLAGLFDRPGPRHDWNPGDQSIAACRQSLENLEV